MKKNSSFRLFPLFFTFVHWLTITLTQTDKLFFTYEEITGLIVGIKILLFFFLASFYYFIFHVIKKIQEGNPLYKRGLFLFSVYFLILMIFMVILYPGTWSHDDAIVLYRDVANYNWVIWHHIVTGIYQELLLQILPFPAGLIILQNALIALIVSFTIIKLETIFNIPILKNRTLDIMLKLIPFLTPPVLMYQFSGYRMGMYIYAELAMLIILLCATKESKPWNWQYTLLFIILSVISISWRSESITYIPFVCLAICLMKKHILPTKQKFLSIALILCLVLLINHTQNTKLENKSYKLLSILNPCVELVLAADTVHDKDLLNDLSRVINLDIIYDNPTKSGTSLYWKYKIFNDNYTKEDYSTCLSAFIKLCLKYPAIVLQERTSLFIQATGMNDDFLSNAEYAIEFFDADNERTAAQNMISADWFANTPLFPNLRKTMLRALNLQSSNSYFSIRRLIWNALIPILILLYAWCKTIQKKNRDYFIITTAIIVKIPIVYLTQPTYWFMYWLSFYLIGYVIIVYGLLHFMTIYTDKNK